MVDPLPSHDNRGPEISAVAILFIILSTVSIFLRSYCRVVIIKSFGWDDGFAVIAWAFFICYSAFSILGVKYGSGQHTIDLPPQDVPVGLKWWWACEPVYILSNMCLKLSIGIFLLRLSVVTLHRVIIWVTLILMEVTSAFYFFIFVLQCRPSSYFWTQWTGGSGSCMDPSIVVNSGYVYSAVSCACDWILGIIPIFVVWNLQMNPRTKISVGIILAMGAVASTATIVRIPYLHNLGNVNDFLYATTDVAIWSTCETGIGITASSLATLRPLFRDFFGRSKLFGSSSAKVRTHLSWPTDPKAGYIRQKNDNLSGASGDCKLRDDIPLQGGVTTTIGSGGEDRDIDLESGDGHESARQPGDARSAQRNDSRMNNGRWSGGNKGTRGRNRDIDGDGKSDTSDDSIWGMHMGIKKTTVSTVTSSMRASRVGREL